jgi:hypothetical protein
MQRIVPAFSVAAALLITASMFAASNPPRFHKPQLTEIVVNLNAVFDYDRYQREKKATEEWHRYRAAPHSYIPQHWNVADPSWDRSGLVLPTLSQTRYLEADR